MEHVTDQNYQEIVAKGLPLVLDFSATWCGPCKREVPYIKAAYDKFHGKDFDVLSLAVWERESQKVSIDTAGELGMNWLHINNRSLFVIGFRNRIQYWRY